MSQREFKPEIYKKWFKTQTKQGFLSIRDFLHGGKFVVDIGEQKAGDELEASQTFINVDDMMLILDKLWEGHSEDIVLYGGGSIDGNPVSRVFKVTPWKQGDRIVEGAYAFKNGIFVADKKPNGAFIPKMDQPLAINMIKVDRDEVGRMRVRCDIALTRFATTFTTKEAWEQDTEFFKVLNGDARA